MLSPHQSITLIITELLKNETMNKLSHLSKNIPIENYIYDNNTPLVGYCPKEKTILFSRDFIKLSEENKLFCLSFGLKLKENDKMVAKYGDDNKFKGESYSIASLSVHFFIVEELKTLGFEFKDSGTLLFKNLLGEVGDTIDNTYEMFKNVGWKGITGLDYEPEENQVEFDEMDTQKT